jgi:hypothetical protein
MQMNRLKSYVLQMCLVLILAGTTLRAAELHISVQDETGRPVWTRLEVRGPSFQMFQPQSAIISDPNYRQKFNGADRYYGGSFTADGQANLELPPGRYTVVAEHGLEYERIEKTIDVTADQPASVSVQLRPWIRMRDLGWYSGDMHVHRTPEEAPSLSLAEDLNILTVITMFAKSNYWQSKGGPVEPVRQVLPDHFVTLMNGEDERGGGAWILHNLRAPLPLGVDGDRVPPGIDFVREARAQKHSANDLFPWFDIDKPTWWEVPVMMALATPDSMGVVFNHFQEYSTIAGEAWGRPRDRDRFPGPLGFTEYSLQLYYRYLNLGFHVPPSAGSASGVLASPVGYDRMYVPVSGPLTVDKWYAAVRAGKVLVTNGPILFLNTKPSGHDLKVSIEAHAREPIDRIEIIANGEVLRKIVPAGDAKDFKGDILLNLGNHSWIAARCFLKTSYTVQFAHTSPIYLPGNWDASADARYFVDWIDELIALTDSDSKHFRNDAEKQEILMLYRRARSFYSAKVQPAFQ